MMRSRFHFFVLILAFGIVSVVKAEAADYAVPDAINDASQQASAHDMALNQRLGKKIDDATNSFKYNMIEIMKDDDDVPGFVPEIQTSLTSVPGGLFVTDQLVKDIQFNNMRYLNRVPMRDIFDLDGDGDRNEKADYLVDSSLKASVNVQFAANYLRLFCDPESRNSYWKDAGMIFENYQMPDGSIVPELEVFCGKSSTTGLMSRETALGGEMDKGIEAQQLISLPLRPADLFFKPTTFPTLPTDGKAPTDASPASNTNRLAIAYYAAFTQTMQLLSDEPPALVKGTGNAPADSPALLAQQSIIARRMMAYYPFALLFAERTGTMGAIAAGNIAATLKRSMGGATGNDALMARIENIQRRNAISVAEYMDIMAYQLLLSPGYYTRISQQMTRSQLRREIVWLTALQTALNYQRNRWMEIDAALEAVR